MTYRSTRWLGWAQALLGLMLVLVFLPAIFAWTAASEKRDYSAVPSLGKPEMLAMLEKNRSAALGKPGDEPADFFATYLAAAEADVRLQKYLHEHPEERSALAARFGIPGTYVADLMQLRTGYETKFGSAAMRDTAAMPGVRESIRAVEASVLVADRSTAEWFGRSAIASFIIAMLFFMARVAGRGMLVWPDLPKIAVYALAWPVMVWKYPTEVSPIEQVRRLKRWIAWLMAGSLPVMSMGAARAQEKTEPAVHSGTVYVLDPEEMPPTLAFSLGVMSAKVAGNGFTLHEGPVATGSGSVSFANGVTLEVSGTRALSGSRGSDEVDLIGSWTGPVAEGANATLGVALYDIQPMGSGKGSDMLSPFASLDWKAGSMTAFARAEGMFLTGGDRGRNGFLLAGGVSESFSLGEGLSFDQTVSLAYGQGPFGQDDGLVLRYAGAVSKPLGERVRLKILDIKAWLPVAGARDRTPAFTVGTSLSYAH